MSTTKNYGKFKNIIGNRVIKPGHVQRLADNISRKNLLKYYPILVNENMEIIDGQHRLLAAAELGLEVPYEVVKGLKIEDVMSINTASKSWGIGEFVDAYISLGVKDYQELKDFANEFNISLGMSATLLNGLSVSDGGNKGVGIKDGTFTINVPTKARRIASQASVLERYTDFPARSDRNLINTLWKLDSTDEFDFERLVSKIKIHSLKIDKKANFKYYVLLFEELYNYNAKTGHRLELYTKVAV